MLISQNKGQYKHQQILEGNNEGTITKTTVQYIKHILCTLKLSENEILHLIQILLTSKTHFYDITLKGNFCHQTVGLAPDSRITGKQTANLSCQ